jgi:hypothetical protein
MRNVGAVLLVMAACDGGGARGLDAATDGAPTSDAAIDAMTDANPTGIGGPPVGHCAEEWCWVLPRPQGTPYAGVWSSSASNVWAATEQGTLLHYDGSSWTQVGGIAEYGGAHMFWGTANDLWLSNLTNTWHWNGTTWTSTDIARGKLGGAGTTPWTVSADESFEWNGAQWLAHTGPGFTPLAIGGNGTTLIAVSETGSIAQWLGNAWGTSDTGSHAGNAAVVIDSTHLVVAQNGTVAFWDNGTWTIRTPPVTANWQQIAATSLSDVWVASFGRRYHWNGNAWSAADDANGAFPVALSLTASGLLVADANAELRLRNGATWSALTTGTNNIRGVWGTAPNDIWIIGGNGKNETLHWNGSTWTDVPFPFPYSSGYQINAIWGSAPNNYWIAGGRQLSFSSREIDLFHWDGIAWTLDGPHGTEDGNIPGGFFALWGTAADNVYAVSGGVALHRDASGWSPISQLSTRSTEADVFGSAANDVYVLKDTTLWRWDGAQWTSKTAPATLRRGWSNGPTDVWLMTSGSPPLRHFDGTFFVSLTQGALPAIGTSTEMWTFGSTTMTKWTGGFAGTATTMTGFFDAWRGWVAPDGHLWVAGKGLLVH